MTQNGGGRTWRTFFSSDVTPTTRLTTGISSIPAGEELARHRHATIESYYFVQGAGVLSLGEQEFEVHSGSAVHIPPLTVHGVRNAGDDTLRFFYVFAADSFMDVECEFGSDAP